MTDAENREHQGVLHPRNGILPDSRIGDGGSLQVQADHIQREIEEIDNEIGNVTDSQEIWLRASALAITVASLITTVIVGIRKAVFKGVRAVGALGKAVANLAKQAGPLLASLLNMLATVISWGATVRASLGLLLTFGSSRGCCCVRCI